MKRIRLKKYVAVLTSVAMIFTGISASAAKKNITFVKSKQTVYVGKKLTLKVSVPKKYKNKTSKIKWSSSNTKVAVVNKKGVVTAKKKGTAVIKAKFYGTTAKCTISIKKKTTVKPTKEPEITKEPEASSLPSTEPTAVPVTTPAVSAEPTAEPTTPSASAVPTVEPQPTASTSPQPTTSAAPTNTPVPAQSTTPSASANPTQTPDVNTGKLVPVSDKGAVKAYGLAKIDGEVATIYLVNKDYNGGLKIGFKDTVYEQSGSIKDSLILLDTTYLARTNSAKTIKISREFPEVYWTISDLKNNKDYYFKVERNNTYDTSYKNCGAIYFKGDVTDVVSVY